MVKLCLLVGFVPVCLRLQLMPVIKLVVAGTEVTIQRRTKGRITGTRLAGALGRIPRYDMIQRREPIWRNWGLKLNDDVLTMSTYVDNIYALAGSVESDIAIVADAELHLREVYGTCR